jgi:hypothetical protein
MPFYLANYTFLTYFWEGIDNGELNFKESLDVVDIILLFHVRSLPVFQA